LLPTGQYCVNVYSITHQQDKLHLLSFLLNNPWEQNTRMYSWYSW